MIRIGDFKATTAQKQAIMEVLESGRLTEGQKVNDLEREMERLLGVKHAIMVTNGTVALQLVGQYIQHKIKKDKLRVIIPALTFPATINAFETLGYEVILCDVGEDMQIDLSKITPREKYYADVIVPVHLMGYDANITKIREEAETFDWIIVEDACEAFGATHGGKSVGTIGDFGCYSFYMSHNISAGELGMVVTNDGAANNILRSMKNHGRVGNPMKFLHTFIGSNYKTTEFSAAIALGSIAVVKTLLNVRKENARFLRVNIKNPRLTPYPITEEFSPLAYPILCDSEKYRDIICERLNKNGIETRDIFPCIANQEAYKERFKHFTFPVANDLEKRVFYVGCHQYLTKKDLKFMVEAINND